MQIKMKDTKFVSHIINIVGYLCQSFKNHGTLVLNEREIQKGNSNRNDHILRESAELSAC